MVSEDEKKIVLARIESLSPYMQLSMGEGHTMDKKKLIEHIKKEDEIGKKFIEIQMSYIRNVARRYG